MQSHFKYNNLSNNIRIVYSLVLILMPLVILLGVSSQSGLLQQSIKVPQVTLEIRM